MLTSEQWNNLLKYNDDPKSPNVLVLDADGWHRDERFDYEWHEERISLHEFIKRARRSTVNGPRLAEIEALVNDDENYELERQDMLHHSRMQLVIEVTPDPVPGAFHTPEDVERRLEQMLNERIPHYMPMVAYMRTRQRGTVK